MNDSVHRRDDVNPDEGERKYGDVEFADETNHKYPIDTEEHVRAAWSYIHQRRNEDKYSDADVEKIEAKIRKAAQRYGIELED